MPVSIVSNNASAIAHRNLGAANSEAQRSISKISSGNRVFEAKEDAGALSIGAGLSKEIAAYRAAAINAQSGTSLMQIADGALAQMTDVMSRMDTLAMQAVSEQISDVERAYIDVEFQLLKDEIDRIAGGTEFNGIPLLGGVNEIVLNSVGTSIDADNGLVGFEFDATVDPASVFEVNFDEVTDVLSIVNATTGAAQSLQVAAPTTGRINEYTFEQLGVTISLNSDFDDTTPIVHAGVNEEFTVLAGATATASVYEFQVGATTAAEDRVVVNLPLVNITELGLATSNVSSSTDALAARESIASALDIMNSARSNLGANMNRLEVAAANIAVSVENAELSRSGLLDADVAAEITNATAQQVLLEASTSMLTQANQTPQILLGLIRG